MLDVIADVSIRASTGDATQIAAMLDVIADVSIRASTGDATPSDV